MKRFQVTGFTMAAKEIFNTVIQTVKDSNLNFTMNLTPFSAHITIKSSFIKSYSPPPTPSHFKPGVEYYLLVDENQELIEEIKKLRERSLAFADTIKILETKLSKSEECARKYVGERNEETATLKLAMKKKDVEVTLSRKKEQLSRRLQKIVTKQYTILLRRVKTCQKTLRGQKRKLTH